ncbi:MAG: hypothetical protein IT237_09970 [Bacteroidia bacterium]|nr:hypothetical protein [Bacteroidia bacterium]
MEVVHGLWVKGQLSALELLTIKSFMHHGFHFVLWSYEKERLQIPENCEQRIASEIIAEEQVFYYTNQNKFGHGKGSYAGFSDVFRYKLLYEYGGIWTDMDMTCLQKFSIKSDYYFRFHATVGAVGNLMKCPKHAPIMQWCYEQSIQEVQADNTDWMLPIKILNKGIKQFGLKQYIFKQSNDDSFPLILKYLTSNKKIDTNWIVFHWMNEEWRSNGISKHAMIAGSRIVILMEQYNIKIQKIVGRDRIKTIIKFSRMNYVFKQLYARVKWYINKGKNVNL